METDLFDFPLPKHAIALRPVHPRDQARLLVVSGKGERATFQDYHVFNLPTLLRPTDVLIFNNTKVIPASVQGWRMRPGFVPLRLEAMLLLEKSPSGNPWETEAFLKPGRRVREGDRIVFQTDPPFLEGQEVFCATVLEKTSEGRFVLTFASSSIAIEEGLRRYGLMPLPPYILEKRPYETSDGEDYQTIYAQKEGAIAAPTAGLHFTQPLFQALKERGIETMFTTLHVGAGTFSPVKASDTRDHVMHEEWGEISDETAQKINDFKREGRRLIAVGTTVVRLLESAADGRGGVRPFSGKTDIFITPGDPFRVIDGMMTNFHLPKSTLFMLVSAFSGLETMRRAYTYALDGGYRFYSYGDASLLLP